MDDFEIEQHYKNLAYSNMKKTQSAPIKLIRLLISLKIAKDQKQATVILFGLIFLVFVASGIIFFQNIKPGYINPKFSEQQIKAFPADVQERMNKNKTNE